MQFSDIQTTTEIDMTQIPEFPASSALQSIEGQNLKGAAFDVLEAYAQAAHNADMREDAFHQLARQTGIPASQLQPMVELNPDLLGHRPQPAAHAHAALVDHISQRSQQDLDAEFRRAQAQLLEELMEEERQAAAHGAHMAPMHHHYGEP